MTVTLAALMVIISVAMPVLAKAQSLSRSTDLTPSPVCPLGRVAVVRGSDSEAREGGGFFAVADGTVVVGTRSDWGKLGTASPRAT
jgi:hypothetical protein